MAQAIISHPQNRMAKGPLDPTTRAALIERRAKALIAEICRRQKPGYVTTLPATQWIVPWREARLLMEALKK